MNAARQRSARVIVACRGGAYQVRAAEPIAAGEIVLEVLGELVSAPDRYSLQIGENLHVTPPGGLEAGDDSEAYRWRFLNHSCRPNAAFGGRMLVALVEIGAGEEITFDYNTTEFEIARPFACECGYCGGKMIRGFRHLSEAERRRAGLVGWHLSCGR